MIISSAETSLPVIQVFVKIMTHHLQIVGIINILEFDWTDELDNIFGG